MTITAHAGETKDSAACCELRENGKIILKAYPNKQGTKLRIVLNELMGYKQTLISPENKLIEFTRRP